MISFIKSSKYPFMAIKYLWNNKKLFNYLIIPLAVNLIISIILLLTLYNELDNLIIFLTPDFNGFFWSILKGILRFLGIAIILIIFPFMFSLISALINPFFRGLLYSKTRLIENINNKTENNSLTIIIQSIVNELKKLILYVILSILVLFFNFIPFIGTICYIIFQCLLTALFVGLEFISPYLEENKLNFSDQIKFVKKNKRMILGFGISAYILLLVPLIQAYFLSTNTIAGALLCTDLDKKATNQ